MKTHIKKMLLLPVMIIAGWAYASINNIDSHQEMDSHSPSMSNDEQIPDLKFTDENGETVSMRSLKGKVVFINLWATWCPPCIHEMPSINKLRQHFKDHDDLVFLMVDMDGNLKSAQSFMKRKKIDLPVHIPDSEIPHELFSGSIPTTIIVDKKNNIAIRRVGGADYMSKGVIDFMTDLLNE